jgi:hypothetical protein
VNGETGGAGLQAARTTTISSARTGRELHAVTAFGQR